MTVATAYGLAHPDIIGEKTDILIFLDAAAAIGELGQVAMFANGRARLFGLLDDRRPIAPRVDDLIVAAFGVQQVAVPRLGFERREVQTTWMRFSNPSFDRSCASGDVHRRGVVFHGLRNRRLARLANALRTDNRAVLASFRGLAAMGAKTALRTLVVASNLEHAIALAGRLDGWPIWADEPVHIAGLTSSQRRIFEQRRGMIFVYDRVIATLARLPSIDMSLFDAVVWAAGGCGLPPLRSQQLLCPAGSPCPLLIVDCRDDHDSRLRRQSAARRAAYD